MKRIKKMNDREREGEKEWREKLISCKQVIFSTCLLKIETFATLPNEIIDY